MTVFEALMLAISFTSLIVSVLSFSQKKNNPPLIVGLWVDYELFTYSVCRSPLQGTVYSIAASVPALAAFLIVIILYIYYTLYFQKSHLILTI